MKATATPLIIAALMATHAYAAECGGMASDGGDKRMLRTSDDAMDSLLADAAVMGASTRSNNRLIAVSTDQDDAAVMSTTKKTTVQSRAAEDTEADKEAITRVQKSDDALPAGVSAVLSKDTMRVQSDAAQDTATMSKVGVTVVKGEDAKKSDAAAVADADADRR